MGTKWSHVQCQRSSAAPWHDKFVQSKTNLVLNWAQGMNLECCSWVQGSRDCDSTNLECGSGVDWQPCCCPTPCGNVLPKSLRPSHLLLYFCHSMEQRFKKKKKKKRMIKEPLPACGSSNTVVQMKMDSVGGAHVLSGGLVPTHLGLYINMVISWFGALTPK